MQAKEKFYLQLQYSYAQACSDLIGILGVIFNDVCMENKSKKSLQIFPLENLRTFFKMHTLHHPRTNLTVVIALSCEQLSLNFLKDVLDAARDVDSTCVPYPTMVFRFEAISLSSLFFMNFHFVVKRPDISSSRL